MTTTARRIRDYARTYASETWGIELRRLTKEELFTAEIRSDSYANAHVEGDHIGNKLCSFTSPLECGLRAAAAELVETMDSDVPDAHVARSGSTPRTTGSHADCAHDATKAARAACRKARNA